MSHLEIHWEMTGDDPEGLDPPQPTCDASSGRMMCVQVRGHSFDLHASFDRYGMLRTWRA